MDIAQSRYTGYNVLRGGEITKRIWLVLTVPLLLCTLQGSHSPPERIRPDIGQRFRIWQSLTITGGNYTRCDIRVIQCTADTDTDNIFNEIRAFHDKLNGADDELTIHLFRNKVDLENHVEMAIKTFYKDKTDSVAESSYK